MSVHQTSLISSELYVFYGRHRLQDASGMVFGNKRPFSLHFMLSTAVTSDRATV